MIYERGLIKGMIWKMTCYDMFIIYFNRGKNWFVPKCLVILARIKYMYIVYSYRTRKLLFWYTNPINECFFSTFNIIRDALVVNNFLCKYFNKQLNPPCLHSSQLRLIPYLHHKRTYPRFADCVSVNTIFRKFTKWTYGHWRKCM